MCHFKTKIVGPFEALNACSDIRRNNGQILKVTEVTSIVGVRKIVIKYR
jgi:hypothetical protein